MSYLKDYFRQFFDYDSHCAHICIYFYSHPKIPFSAPMHNICHRFLALLFYLSGRQTTTRKCCNNFTCYAGSVLCLHLVSTSTSEYRNLDILCRAACNPSDFIALLFPFFSFHWSFQMCQYILALYLIAMEMRELASR